MRRGSHPDVAQRRGGRSRVQRQMQAEDPTGRGIVQLRGVCDFDVCDSVRGVHEECREAYTIGRRAGGGVRGAGGGTLLTLWGEQRIGVTIDGGRRGDDR